jgi:lysophospholipase L1-like esterase
MEKLSHFPLYHSARFGYKLFRQSYIDHAAMPESYVLNHPNRPHLDKTFDRMKNLSQQHHFGVTVVIVPSAPRLYKNDFEGFPPIADPYFIRYVTLLAQKTEFDVLDLNEALKPYSSQELLYHRDDTHWNERGHQIVAKILGDDLVRRRTPRPAPGH